MCDFKSYSNVVGLYSAFVDFAETSGANFFQNSYSKNRFKIFKEIKRFYFFPKTYLFLNQINTFYY